MRPNQPKGVKTIKTATCLCVLSLLVLLVSTGPGCRSTSWPFAGSSEPVGHDSSRRTVTPVNQVLTPEGIHVQLPGVRPQALALSPDGQLLVTSGLSSELLVIDPGTGAIRQRVQLPSSAQNEPVPDVVSTNILAPDTSAKLSFTGLTFSPDGRRIYLSNVNGNIKVFTVDSAGKVAGSFSMPLPQPDEVNRKTEIPTGLCLSPDGKRLYVALNLSNRLAETDALSGKILRLFDVGVAPYDVKLVGNKAYVSNWGGRRPGPGDLTGPAGRGTVVRVDPVRHIACEGSVSVIDLGSGNLLAEVGAGLHASALAVSPDGRYVVCANAAADNLSVIDTSTDTVVETVWVKKSPADVFGASPNALGFDAAGKTLYVANGTQNAVAVVKFRPAGRASELLGLIPVGWFPGAIAFDGPRARLHVANIKGLAKDRLTNTKTGETGYNSRQFTGSLSIVPLPRPKELKRLSAIVWNNYRHEQLAVALRPPRPDRQPQPVPERIGEPSVFKHVVYIIKENRTYDQVLGDEPRGNGNTNLCVFGRNVSPNQHKMVADFVLLDNTYCCGLLSADGHQWSTSAFATDYMEKSFSGFPRSYPDGMTDNDCDALAYSPRGFIWDNVLAHGKTLRNYGEFCAPDVKWLDPARKGAPDFLSCYRTWKGLSNEVSFSCHPVIASLKPYVPTNYVGWSMSVPDQYRADCIIGELKEYEARGEYPALVVICLPNDHTSGAGGGSPTVEACVADNDLAFGRIVEAISHSKFWKETVIFAIEDDPQNGWDHVSGYRTTAYCISPYTRRGAVVSTQYNTTSILRTIEQILGLPPMNQFDATATPMFDCFTTKADFTPFVAVSNNIPIDQMNREAAEIPDRRQRRYAQASARLPLAMPDQCPEDLLNRIIWHTVKGPDAPYPEWATTPGADED